MTAMKRTYLIAGMMLLFVCSYSQDASSDTARADANIQLATVYFGYGAEITHQSKVKVDPGTKILIINQLSTTVDVNSLQISVPEDVALLSQQFSMYTPVVPTPVKSRDAEKLEDSITLTYVEVNRINNLIAIEQETMLKTAHLIETTINTSGNKTITSEQVL